MVYEAKRVTSHKSMGRGNKIIAETMQMQMQGI